MSDHLFRKAGIRKYKKTEYDYFICQHCGACELRDDDGKRVAGRKRSGLDVAGFPSGAYTRFGKAEPCPGIPKFGGGMEPKR